MDCGGCGVFKREKHGDQPEAEDQSEIDLAHRCGVFAART
jgi:hypothetical protein